MVARRGGEAESGEALAAPPSSQGGTCASTAGRRPQHGWTPARMPGGMENPCLTFVTPTLVAGDRSLVNVVAHEIAHSWTGNLVTNASWWGGHESGDLSREGGSAGGPPRAGGEPDSRGPVRSNAREGASTHAHMSRVPSHDWSSPHAGSTFG